MEDTILSFSKWGRLMDTNAYMWGPKSKIEKRKDRARHTRDTHSQGVEGKRRESNLTLGK